MPCAMQSPASGASTRSNACVNAASTSGAEAFNGLSGIRGGLKDQEGAGTIQAEALCMAWRRLCMLHIRLLLPGRATAPRGGRLGRHHAITDAAHGLDHPATELAAQPAHVHFNRVAR